jgi:ABC-type phosphate transport system substrate-binding protein
MHHRMAKLAIASAGVTTAFLAFAVPPASADLAPQPGDAVGVGSDTVQYASDFLADGSYVGTSGFNTTDPAARVVNFDATPDANARLAYGSGGSAATCGPGTGTHNGTGNDTSTHADTLCTLNPTIVLEAGTKPIQRPNGSGAGATALSADTTTSTDAIAYSRASSCQDTSCGATKTLDPAVFDVLTLGKDPLHMLAASTTDAPAGLSIPELLSIYNCTVTKWNQLPGNSGGSSATIIPVIPQVGSGTRSQFESDIGFTGDTFNSCVKTAEENDPTAIAAQSSPADAIEPMSGGRLNLFQGLSGKTGNALAGAGGGYFQDPTCPQTKTGGVNTGGTCGTKPLISPAVGFLTGTAPDGDKSYLDNRLLFVYFRKADLNSATPFEPGSTLNLVRTLFYNPCSGSGCTGFGPGGAPLYDSSVGQNDIAAAGINPFYDVSTTGAQTLINNDGSPLQGNGP